MRRKRFTEEQIIGILKEAEAGGKTTELCRRHGISEQTFYRWKAKYGGLEVNEARGLRQLEHENTRLKRLVADLGDTENRELRVFLKSVVCDLCRFRHAMDDGVPPAATQIHQEVRLGPGAFADIRIAAGDLPPYFVEVDYGYSRAQVVESMGRKYSRRTQVTEGASKVIVLVDAALIPEQSALEAELRGVLAPGLGVEVWDDRQLLTIIQKTFGLEVPALAGDRLLELGQAIDRAKAAEAFGIGAAEDPLQSMLLWHFASWRLGQLREAGCVDERAILPPGLYAGVVVLMADLCAYSSYVRDTRDDRVIRESLTAFASKTRYRILNDGGMLYQFLGDAVIGFFGIPSRGADDASGALACARGLLDVGASVAEQVQRMGRVPGLTRRGLNRAVAQASRVIEPAEHQRGSTQPPIEASESDDVSARGQTLDELLAFPQPAQRLARLAELRQDPGGGGDRFGKQERDVPCPEHRNRMLN